MGGVRISAYDPIRNAYGRLLGEQPGRTSLPTKIAAALTAGVSGGVSIRGGMPATAAQQSCRLLQQHGLSPPLLPARLLSCRRWP